MKNTLNQKKIKEIILEWEQKFPVNEWQIQGIDIWPFLRIKLYIFLLNLDTEKKSSHIPDKPLIGKGPFHKNIIRDLKRIITAKKMLNEFFKSLKPKRIVFFGSHFHRTRHNEILFNRFFDSMVDAHQLQDDVYMVEFGKIYEKNYNQKSIQPLHKFLDQYKLIEKFKMLLFSPGKESQNLNGFETFYEQLYKRFPASKMLNISLEALNKWAQKVNRSKGFFINFYNRTRPEKIIFLSYYGYDDLAAAILAAHELGIKTIDFQHGPQTNVHMAYSSWNKHPERPYNIMPLEYWTWDQKSKVNIEEWAQKTQLIQVRNVGHPYLAYYNNKISFEEIGKYIFFSLQTLSLEEMFPAVLLDYMKESKLQWILRTHPRNNFTKKELESFLKMNKIYQNSYKIEDALNNPLPESLVGARLHITNFSGCVIEAGMLNIPSLIIHETGKEIFQAYIDEKSVFYLNPVDPVFKEKFRIILEKLPEKSNEREYREIHNPLA